MLERIQSGGERHYKQSELSSPPHERHARWFDADRRFNAADGIWEPKRGDVGHFVPDQQCHSPVVGLSKTEHIWVS